MNQTPVKIGGSPVTKARTIEIRNPYNDDVVGIVPQCDAADVDRACKAAKAALDRDDFPQHQRAAVLERAAVLLRSRIEELARIIMREGGKPIRTARSEVERCVDTLVFSAVEARKLTGEMIPMAASVSGAGKLAFALRIPIGVIGAITPFNFPLNLVAHKLAPAIAAGCPVVLKPAPQTPLTALALVDLLFEAGLPQDWISTVTDGGKEAGEPLVEHDIPKMITFTGSAPVGWMIASKAAKKRVSLELGSNSPLIVEPDGDVDTVIKKLGAAAFGNAGQSCISVQRLLVHESICAPFTDKLIAAMRGLVVGDPADEKTDVGPMIRSQENERVAAWLQEAVQAGAKVLLGGKPEGRLFPPTVVADAPSSCKLYRNEVFGPVLLVNSYRSFDQAIEMANDSDFGLHAGVFTRNLGRALEAAKRLEFGGVLINEVPTFRADQQPYGGVADAGNTREGPAYTVAEMTELRFVSLQA